MDQEERKVVLIVDDEPEIVEILEMVLKSEGFEVKKAFNGVACLEAVYMDGIDLILLDIRMPKLDGYEVCKRLRGDEKTKDIPIIVITAHFTEEVRARFEEHGVQGYVTKPFVMENLVRMIKEVA